MGNGAMAIGLQLPRPSSTLPFQTCRPAADDVRFGGRTEVVGVGQSDAIAPKQTSPQANPPTVRRSELVALQEREDDIQSGRPNLRYPFPQGRRDKAVSRKLKHSGMAGSGEPEIYAQKKPRGS